MVKLLMGLSGSGESQSRDNWHPVRVVTQAGNIWKTDLDVAKVELQ